LKVTVPVGGIAPVVVTVAVNVTATPAFAGFRLDLRVVVVVTAVMVWVRTSDVLPALFASPP